MTLAQDVVAALGEFVGTTLFLLLALGGAKTATYTRSAAQTEGLETTLGNQTILFIACSFGLSLLITAWMFYRITGGLFNPAITLALYLVGAVPAFRALLLVLAQLLGGIAGAALVAALTPFGGADSTRTLLEPGINIGQGLMIEAFLTAILVFSVLMLAAEKHRSTYLAPIGIGLTIFACHLFGVLWTGCGINPARAFGPSVVSASFPSYHWIYHVGPMIGALIAVAFYTALKAFDYTTIVFGQDADHEERKERKQGESASTTTRPLDRIASREWKLRGGGGGKGRLLVIRKKGGKSRKARQERQEDEGLPLHHDEVEREKREERMEEQQQTVDREQDRSADAQVHALTAALQSGEAVILDMSNLEVSCTSANSNGGGGGEGSETLAQTERDEGAIGAPGSAPSTMVSSHIMQDLLTTTVPITGVPSMRADAQNTGGLQAPGSVEGG